MTSIVTQGNKRQTANRMEVLIYFKFLYIKITESTEKIDPGLIMDAPKNRGVIIGLSIIIVAFAVLSIIFSELKIFTIFMLVGLSIQNFYLWLNNKKELNKQFVNLQLAAGIFVGIVAIVLLIIRIIEFTQK